MSMSSNLDGSDEIIPEDWPTYYTAVPVWVLLSGVVNCLSLRSIERVQG